MKKLNAITDVPGIKVGHFRNFKALTGCTVILCEEEAAVGVDIRGTALRTFDLRGRKPWTNNSSKKQRGTS